VARTLLMASLQQALTEAERSAEPDDANPGWFARPRNRRDVLRAAAAAVAAGTAWSALGCGSSPPPEHDEEIVVVGGGLAGLVCAHRLKQAGHRAILHEASDRLGGRVWTIRGVFADGQIAEHGGELIDSGHVSLRRLIAELGLDLDNVIAGEKPGTGDVFHFNGARYPVKQAVEDFGAVYPALKRDLRETGYPTLHNRHKPRGVELDRMSIADWIGENVPDGLQSDLGKLLAVAYNTEFGADISGQTSLNLLYLLGYSGGGRLRLFGASNEKFRVRGGNDLVVQRLAAELEGQLRVNSELTEIKRQGDGTYRLAFDSDGGSSVVKAPQVILALPFAVMRESVDYSDAGFDPVKRMAIEQQGMGTNSKLNVQFSERGWRSAAANGTTYADTGYQSTWEASRAQSGRAGILVDYTGGTIGKDFGGATAADRAQGFLDQLEPVFPRVPASFNGRAVLDYWTGRPFTRGSYAYYRVGQMTAFAGVEGKPSGNCHFAGEHTSYTFQGYMEGAVKSGERAAGEVVTSRTQGAKSS
jgi:monoamine oxidase